jgi:CHAT domain-containing protein
VSLWSLGGEAAKEYAMVNSYSDFSLTIAQDGEGRYPVRAFTPDAEAETFTELPFRAEELGGILNCLGAAIGAAPGDLGRAVPPEAPPDLKGFGRQLFGVLFRGEVGELYATYWSAAARAGHGVRIRLHLRPRKAGQAWLSRIPWELMYDDRAGIFPCLSALNPLVRHLDLPRTAERLPFESPLRVLVAASSPQGAAMLDLEGEQRRIDCALAGGQDARVKILDRASPRALRQELLADSYQILHFMGHGLIEKGGGGLLFTTAEGYPVTVSGEMLAHLVQVASPPKLTILNACHSAVVPEGTGDLLAGVAATLVNGGQPAVIGMQFPISDRAALLFSEALYERLGAGEPIEAAVAEGRLAVFTGHPESAADWASPVLFLRGADRRVSEAKERHGRRAVEKPAHKVTVRTEGKLKGKTVGLSAIHHKGSGVLHPNQTAANLSVEAKQGIESSGDLMISVIKIEQPDENS